MELNELDFMDIIQKKKKKKKKLFPFLCKKCIAQKVEKRSWASEISLIAPSPTLLSAAQPFPHYFLSLPCCHVSTAPLAASANCRELASFQCSLDCFRTLDPDANAGTPNISQSSDCTEVSSTRNSRSVSEWS